MTAPQPGIRTIAIPTVDISNESARQSVVAQGTEDVYQGHPTTVLMPDGKTIYCVWTINHGGPCGPRKRSDDGGKTWSELLAVPDSWHKTRNCPAIYRLPATDGTERLFVFAGQGPGGQMHQSHSTDGGKTWTPMAPNGLVGVMPFCSIKAIDGGKRLLAMDNIRRPGDTTDKWSNILAQSVSDDGGDTWSPWEIILDIPECKLCEPELVRSPDGKQLLCLIRENNRVFNAWMMTSNDEGRTWSLPKLLHSHAGFDCGYPGLECLPDGTLVATTYVKYESGPKKHSVVSVRFTLDELDRANIWLSTSSTAITVVTTVAWFTWQPARTCRRGRSANSSWLLTPSTTRKPLQPATSGASSTTCLSSPTADSIWVSSPASISAAAPK